MIPEGEDVRGPYYYKMFKSNKLRFVESMPKGKHVVEYIERIDYYGQDKMHYFNLMRPVGSGHVCTYECDFRSVCGYDRGPKFEGILSRILSL